MDRKQFVAEPPWPSLCSKNCFAAGTLCSHCTVDQKEFSLEKRDEAVIKPTMTKILCLQTHGLVV
jgi:hypothetical protein